LKKVRNIHYLGKLNEKIVKREMVNMISHAVIIPVLENFEKVYKPNLRKIEKAVHYIKWKREIFRLETTRNVGKDEMKILFDRGKTKVEIQMKFNSFLILKFTMKWNIYAEIALFSGNIVFGNLNSRKKGRGNEIIFDIMKNSILKIKFEVNKLYILGSNELEFLIQWIKKKKRRRSENIIMKEETFDLWKGEVSINWKHRKKKPQDKIDVIEFKTLNVKLLNQFKNKLKKNRGKERKVKYTKKEKR
jgi:hypothetical protein